MKKGLTGKWLAAVALLTTAVGCSDEDLALKKFTFNAQVEQPGGGSKLMLSGDGTHAENTLLWEYNDKISIGSDQTRSTVASGNADTASMAWLYNYTLGSEYNGIFETQLPETSKYFVALHPYSRSNSIVGSAANSSTFSTVNINLPATQGYRNDTTFDKQVYPLVAWSGSSSEWVLDFKSIAAIVRIQIYNSGATETPIRKIEFTETTGKRLNGVFTVSDYSSSAPYLTAASSPTSAEQKITIDCGEDGVAFTNGKLLTFYLVLPAVSTTTSTSYALSMTVTNTSSGTATLSFTAPTKRNSITYMPALSIGSWGGTPSPTLSGNGTARRPFRIYTKAELQYLRTCYAAEGTRTINGQEITEDTYIQIMRPDIKLRTASDWPAGIKKFVGHLTYVPNSGSILNNTPYPLIDSVTPDGVVSNLRVTYDTNVYSGDNFAPVCRGNAGTITGCVILGSTRGVAYTSSADHGTAGICVYNTGTISTSVVGATFTNASRNVAGIALYNSGTINGCYTDGMTVSSASAASGICDNNSGTIIDCSFKETMVSNSSSAWYGIARYNTGTVRHCSLSSTAAILSTQAVGGIVGTNATGGVVNSCYITNTLTGSGIVGGIVNTMTGGSIINCYVQNEDAVITGTTAGGIVGSMSAGTISNSFAYFSQATATTKGGIAGSISGGSITNCYCYQAGVSSGSGTFFGSNSSGTLTSCYVVDGAGQASVTAQTTTQATDGTLRGYLNSGMSSISGARTWQNNSDTGYPELTTYAAK